MTLTGRVALIRGAGGGIGRAITLAFAAAEAAVVCCDIEASAVGETVRLVEAAGGRAISRRCDVSVETETGAVAASAQEAFGQLDILVNGAAPNDPSGTILETSVADWERVLAVNLTVSFLLNRAVLPLMIAGVAVRSPSSLRSSDAWGAAGERPTAPPRVR
jgi:NAD(P)-dependent dehydrogenase (short-subunit alcohol dehydrogenase family)